MIDAVNKLQRITESEPEGTYHDHSQEAAQKANKFYAQRNLYLCGFTLFLSLYSIKKKYCDSMRMS